MVGFYNLNVEMDKKQTNTLKVPNLNKLQWEITSVISYTVCPGFLLIVLVNLVT